MRIVAALIVILLVIWAVAWECLWRMSNSAIGEIAASPSGNYVAQIRSLTEQSVVPYGQGVFVRHKDIPLWATSKLVFAGTYYKPGMRLHWRSSTELVIECAPADGSAKMLQAPKGVVVTHSGNCG